MVDDSIRVATVNSVALENFDCIRGFMGDTYHAFPRTLGDEVVKRGIFIREIRDEIYSQVLLLFTRFFIYFIVLNIK